MAKGTAVKSLLGNLFGSKKVSSQKAQAKEQNTKITEATKNTTSPKNTGSTPQANGTTIAKTNTQPTVKTTTTPETTIPNTNPTKTGLSLKKAVGIGAGTFGLGALVGGVGTWLSGVQEAITPDDKIIDEGLIEGEEEATWWDDMNSDASELLEPLADIPGVGDLTEAAQEGGWSLPLLIGIVVLVIAAVIFIYKKVIKKTKITRPRRTKTTKRGGKR